MTLLISVALLVSFLCSFFFAGVETGFVSWNPHKVSFRARQGNVTARWAVYLLQYKERIISMVLIGNNITIVGATLAFLYLYTRLNQLIQIDIEKIPSPETWFLSPVLIIFCEMLPKSLFRIYSFRLTMRSIPLLMIMYWLTLPFTWIFSNLGKVFQKNVQENNAYLTRVRKEMVLIAQEGSRKGTLFEYATLFIDNILKLKKKTLKDLRYLTAGWYENGNDGYKQLTSSDTVAGIFSRENLPEGSDLLVYDTEGRTAVGWLSLLDIAKAEKNTRIETIMKPLPQIFQNTSLLTCLNKKVDFHFPFYRIVDQNGKTTGIMNRFSLFRLIFDGYSTV